MTAPPSRRIVSTLCSVTFRLRGDIASSQPEERPCGGLISFATYLYGLKFVAISLAVLMLVSGLDDLVIDVVYWVRRAWRAVTVYRVHDRLDSKALYGPMEKPLAIMVPAWHETGVIGKMAELAATTLDYENYHIFVGTYPNDPDTQRDVDEVCARFRNVHKVVCARPGPDQQGRLPEQRARRHPAVREPGQSQFAGFILHDAEDVISQMELRLFNYLVERKDLIQLPVYPFERKWSDFTSAHYMDEFAELHGKDILVREALAGQVPSAGVGTCFSRRARHGAARRRRRHGVRRPEPDRGLRHRLQAQGQRHDRRSSCASRSSSDGVQASARPTSFGQSAREASVICVREYFPEHLSRRRSAEDRAGSSASSTRASRTTAGPRIPR